MNQRPRRVLAGDRGNVPKLSPSHERVLMPHPLKILIVEDEALLAMELESLVEEAGHTVVGWAVSSKAAKDLALRTDADLVFLDWQLADGPTGPDVARFIHKHRAAMVVFVTANAVSPPEDLVGAAGVITKPFTGHGVTAALSYLEEGVREPPPRSRMPISLQLAPRLKLQWGR